MGVWHKELCCGSGKCMWCGVGCVYVGSMEYSLGVVVWCIGVWSVSKPCGALMFCNEGNSTHISYFPYSFIKQYPHLTYFPILKYLSTP